MIKRVKHLVDRNKDSNIVNSGETKEGSKFVVKKDLVGVLNIQEKIRSLFNNFKTSSLIPQAKRDDDDLLKDMNDKITSHTYGYINKIKSVSGDDITRFLNKTIRDNSNVTNNMMGIRSAEDLFNNDGNNFQAFFFERYKNINNKYEDLRIITEYLYELEEAVTTMRDNIAGADDLVSMISREISFGNVASEEEDSSKILTQTVYNMEDEYKLKERLKNIIIPKTLTYGNYFVYTIPYRDIFAQFDYRRKIDIQNGVSYKQRANQITKEGFVHPTLESFNPTSKKSSSKDKNSKLNAVVENLTNLYNSGVEDPKAKVNREQISGDLKNILEGIEICDQDFIPFMEDGNISTLSDDDIRNEAIKAYRKASKPTSVTGKAFWERQRDGIVDLDEVDNESKNEYKDISGVFVKLYDPERVIPVYVMDSCIGYYVLYEAYGEIRNSILLNSSLNRTNLAYSQVKRKELDDEVINVISDAICASIDKKYVANNPNFKELIANAISYQDFFKRKFKVQFIPVQYMTHFKINEDPDTHNGVSVLNKSLFYGKLYLSLLLFKIITILTKSNDMRVYYIRNAGLNKNMVNRVQEIARGIKDKQISFNDLASIQTIFSKVGAYKEAFIPMGKSGEKNIEFDIISGQDVQLNTDLMELLRKGMVNNSGVPSVILSYMEEADFAKTIVMQHAKYLVRIIALQTELEQAVTELYKKILKYDGKITDENQIDQFSFNFTRPKSLNTQDMGDLIGNAETLADFLTKMLVDENDSELTAATKQELIKGNLLKGVFNWAEFEETVKNVTLSLKQKKAAKGIIGEGES